MRLLHTEAGSPFRIPGLVSSNGNICVMQGRVQLAAAGLFTNVEKCSVRGRGAPAATNGKGNSYDNQQAGAIQIP